MQKKGRDEPVILDLWNARLSFELHCYFLEGGRLDKSEDDVASESARLDIDACSTEN